MGRQLLAYEQYSDSWQSLISDYDGSLKNISAQNYALYAGKVFLAGGYFDVTGSSAYDILAITPPTGEYYFVYDVSVEHEATASFYENATTTNNGTTMSSFNLNRNSANSCGIAFLNAPVLSTTGTLLLSTKAGSTKKVGGGIPYFRDWILKQNTKYLFRILNDTVSNNWTSFRFISYLR